jgi:hypothetical protein
MRNCFAAAARGVVPGHHGAVQGPMAGIWIAGDYAMPALLDDPAVRRFLVATGSASEVPHVVPWLLLALGVGLMWLPVRQLLRGKGV